MSLVSGILEGGWYTHVFEVEWWGFSVLQFVIVFIFVFILVGLMSIKIRKN